MEVSQQLWVADIHDECILGLDFLQSHGCLVNPKDSVLMVGREGIPLRKFSMEEPSCCKVVLQEEVTIPPYSETVVAIQTLGIRPGSKWGILEKVNNKYSRSLNDVLMGQTLVDLDQRHMFLRMMNLSNDQKKLTKDMEMAEIVPVCAVLNTKGRSGQSSRQCQLYEPDQRLPTHLEELYK